MSRRCAGSSRITSNLLEPPIRIMTIFGTRPEIIRLSLLIPVLDQHSEHLLVHTGQNYEPQLSDIFLSDLRLRKPDEHLEVRSGRFAEQASLIIDRADAVMDRLRPDRILILGDTNSGFAALPAARRRIPVYHLEAGNRCYDDRVPEEVNRRIIDHCSTFLLPYTQRSKENLIREGIESDRIFVVGNPIYEVLTSFDREIAASTVHQTLKLETGRYILVTMHRAENVDDSSRLRRLCSGLSQVAAATGLPLVWPVHPRTADRLAREAAVDTSTIVMTEPLGLFDFVRLEREAACVMTDSGTVQEECAILRIPNVTIRDVTERPETVEAGSNVLAGSEPASLVRAVALARSLPTDWVTPPEYLIPHPSIAIAKIVLGHASFERHLH